MNPSIADAHQSKAIISKVAGTHTFRLGSEFKTLNFEENWYQSGVNFAAQQTEIPAT